MGTMKITWFAGVTFRIHIAGSIVVTDPDGAPGGIDTTELVSGAQFVVSGDASDLSAFDPETWQPRKRGRLIDEDEGSAAISHYRLGARGLFVESVDDGVLALVDAGDAPDWGRWADNAVLVLSGTGSACAEQGRALLEVARPKLIALAIEDGEIDVAFDAIVPHLGDASLTVLEPGLAVEV
jgi:hypothetical protein